MAEHKASITDELLKFAELKERGILSEEEFTSAKAALLRTLQAATSLQPGEASPAVRPTSPEQSTSEAREWGVGSVVIGVLVLIVAVLASLPTAVALGLYLTWLKQTVHSAQTHANFAAMVRQSCIGISFAFALAIMPALIGLVFGIVGLWRARARKLPAGISATGVTICGITIVLAIVGLVVTLAIMGSLANQFEEQRRLRQW